MKTLEVAEANTLICDYAQQPNKEPVVLTIDGKPVAALVPIEDIDLEALSLSTNPDFIEIIERSRKRLKEEGGISTDEMRKQLGLPSKSKRKT